MKFPQFCESPILLTACRGEELAMTLGVSIHTGTVLWYDCGRGYGFVADHYSAEKIFITHTALEDLGLKDLNKGSRICFDVTKGKASCKVHRIRSLTPCPSVH